MMRARSEEREERRGPEAWHAGSQSDACGGSPAGGVALSGFVKVDQKPVFSLCRPLTNKELKVNQSGF